MESLYNLLFELSNEDRLGILRRLDEEVMNVTNISGALGLTTQESSRHLSRLREVGLTRKDVDGSHRLTPYGELALKQLKGLEFMSEHRDYFVSHTLARVPREFVYRMGELAESSYMDDISAAFYSVEKAIREAEEYVLSITDQYLLNTNFLIAEACERGVKVKNIEEKSWVPSPEIMRAYRAEDAIYQAVLRARSTGLLKESVLEGLDVYLFMSEKTVAIVGFPLPDRRFDYLGFMSEDERSHKWCKDLFQHYWERTQPRARVVEELHDWVKKRPGAVHALKNIAAGKKTAHEEDLTSEFESRALTRRGKLTLLGLFVNEKLRK